jgi:hypothetical protein
MAWKTAFLGLWITIAGLVLAQQGGARKEVTTESYEVYSAVLAQHYGSWFKRKDPVLIFSETALEPQGHQGANCGERTTKVKVVEDLLEKLLSEKEKFQIFPKLRLPGK